MRTLYLDRLKEGLPEISLVFGALFSEAAAVCLTTMGHKPGVRLHVEGDYQAEFQLDWTQEIGKTEISVWKDLKEAAEYAATAIALLLVAELTDFSVFKRNNQNQVADFDMIKHTSSHRQPEVNVKGKLEISGILKETTNNTLHARVLLKARKIKTSGAHNHLPVFVVVVEFGVPKAKIIVTI